ncbi:centrosomal protein of 78 kDa isoform X1 [Anabrus simplex]|uniref:centrosomal protein of 78 kDa isoform X1 n=1 Tax=Anabrus simplex TaxID=316456 RepID=UPI0034DD70DC
MIPSTKERKKNAGFFRLCYDGLCRRQNLMPLSGVKAHLTKNTLDFNGDRVKLEEWGPILLALGLDRSLHFIAIRSRHPARKALEDIDTEIKARSVTKRPVLLTRYILYMLVDSLSQCLSNSLVLTCLELEGLPLGIDYLSVLCQGITACKSLQNISFYRSNIGDEGCGKLCMIIRNLPNIISLDFSGCELTEKGAISIAEMLKFQSLQRYNETWKQTLRYRSPNMEAMPGLRRVTLNHNMHLGNQGVLHLVDAIKEDLWLRAIDLQNCGVGESGATCVLEMLDVNNSLYIADLRGNRGVRENLIQQIMRKLASNNNNVTHEYQWISLDPQLMKKPSSCSLASKPSFYSCRSIRSSIHPPVFRPPVSNVSKSTLNRCPSVSVVSNQNFPKKKTTGIPWRIDVRMKQVKNTTNATPGTPQMIHNCETICPTVSITPPPTPCASGLNGISKMKPDALMERLAKEISLRKEAEQQKEGLQQEVQRLMKELEKEQAEKEGFCLLKVEAFEAIQQTLDRFVDFMRNVKKAQAADLLELEESQEIQHQSQDEPQTQHSVIKKSHSAHVNSSTSHHRPCRISKSASVFSPEEAAPVQTIEKEMGDCLKSSRLPASKSSKPIKSKPVSPNPRKPRVKLTQKVDGVTRKPKVRRSVPLISSGSLSGDHTDRGYSSELENRMISKQSESLISPKSVQVTKVQEIFEDLIQEYDNNGTLMVKKRNGLIDRKLQSLENEMLKDVVKTRSRLLNGMKPKPLNVPSLSVRRKVNHKLGKAASKEGKSQPEYDTDSSGRSKSWSVFSKSSSVRSTYSTEDDVY